LKLVDYANVKFIGHPIKPKGLIRLPVSIGEGKGFRNLKIDFLVVDVESACNVIIGRNLIYLAQQ